MTKDVQDGGFTTGGTVTYAGLLASRLGLHTSVVTSCAPEMDLESRLPGIELAVRPSAETTSFKNVYEGSIRHQRLLGHAEVLSARDVPDGWRDAGIVLLGPVAAELADDVFHAFDRSLLGLTPQGMMRAWDERGYVRAVRWERAEELLDRVDVLVLSPEDLPEPTELARFTQLVDVVAVTESSRGAVVYERGRGHAFPAYRSRVSDPTGAGDTFAAAFLVELSSTGCVERAAHFANCAASFVIEAEGPSGLPDRGQVEERMARAEFHEESRAG